MASDTQLPIIHPPPPCSSCEAACCKTYGHVGLLDDEKDKYEHARKHRNNEWIIPAVDGRCPYLGDDDRCSIYEDRPRACRDFSCVHTYGLFGVQHGEFLAFHPEVASLIERELPDFVVTKAREAKARAVAARRIEPNVEISICERHGKPICPLSSEGERHPEHDACCSQCNVHSPHLPRWGYRASRKESGSGE